MSFASSHPGRQLGDTVEVEAGGRTWPIKLFPPHCVAGTPGAELAGRRCRGRHGVAADVAAARAGIQLICWYLVGLRLQ